MLGVRRSFLFSISDYEVRDWIVLFLGVVGAIVIVYYNAGLNLYNALLASGGSARATLVKVLITREEYLGLFSRINDYYMTLLLNGLEGFHPYYIMFTVLSVTPAAVRLRSSVYNMLVREASSYRGLVGVSLLISVLAAVLVLPAAFVPVFVSVAQNLLLRSAIQESFFLLLTGVLYSSSTTLLILLSGRVDVGILYSVVIAYAASTMDRLEWAAVASLAAYLAVAVGGLVARGRGVPG